MLTPNLWLRSLCVICCIGGTQVAQAEAIVTSPRDLPAPHITVATLLNPLFNKSATKAEIEAQSNYIFGFANGVIDAQDALLVGLVSQKRLLPTELKEIMLNELYCFPKAASRRDVILSAMDWIEAHRSEGNADASPTIKRALHQQWPCRLTANGMLEAVPFRAALIAPPTEK